MKKAILFGASGFVGSCLLDELLNNADYSAVTVVVRKDLSVSHPKLRTLIADYAALPGLKEQIEADDVFITLGTTKKKTPDQKLYYQIDHDYPVLAARIAKERGAKAVFVVTAVGADAGSGIFYVRTKGETERDIIALGMEHTHIFRPSMIMGNRKESRPLEKVLIGLFRVINPIFGSGRYRGIEGKDIARAMNNAAGERQMEKVKVYQWKEMKELL
ncbi:MAG TPA: NAD(P)H-binding protein [Puia sp.]|nr:NAD(P)H-binding protein [Puia sp.]